MNSNDAVMLESGPSEFFSKMAINQILLNEFEWIKVHFNLTAFKINPNLNFDYV